MEKKDIRELVGTYGWVEIPSKNIYMISFSKDESKERMNVYFTTMTVTIDGKDGSCIVHRKVDVNQLEKIAQ